MVPQGEENTKPPWLIAEQVARHDERITTLEKNQDKLVTKDEHFVTKAISWGLAALTLSTVLALVLARVLGR